MDPNQQPQYNNIPSIKQPGEWSPVSDQTYIMPPPKKPFLGRYKRLVIIFVVAMVVLVGVAVMATLTTNKNGKSDNLPGSTTSVSMTNYDGKTFSMQYPQGLSIIADEEIDEENSGWYLLIMDDQSDSAAKYSIYVSVSKDDPFYIDDEDAINQEVDDGVSVSNFRSSEVVLAGNKTTKGEADYVGSEDQNYVTRYSQTKIGDKYISVFAYNLADDSRINDSFDAMLGSIRLK